MTHGNARHRDTGSKEYHAWIHLKRKSEICESWRHSYENFLADAGRAHVIPGKRVGLRRLDPSKPYGPGNVIWKPC